MLLFFLFFFFIFTFCPFFYLSYVAVTRGCSYLSLCAVINEPNCRGSLGLVLLLKIERWAAGATFAFAKQPSLAPLGTATSRASCFVPNFVKHLVESSTCQPLHIYNTQKRVWVRENTALSETPWRHPSLVPRFGRANFKRLLSLYSRL